MPDRPSWTEPTLFSAVGMEYPALTVDLTVHLDGPRGRVQAITSVRDPRETGHLSIIGHPSADLECAVNYATELLADAIRAAAEHVTPF
jgi:hypothetical protein